MGFGAFQHQVFAMWNSSNDKSYFHQATEMQADLK